MKPRISLTLLLAIGLIGACNKSEDDASKPSTAAVAGAVASGAASPAVERPPSYPATTQPGRILVGDLLGLEVDELIGPGQSPVFPEQVAADGTIAPPDLAKPVAVAGMTTWEAGEAIGKAYKAENLIERAGVRVRRLRVAGTGGPPPGPIGPYDLVRITISDLSGPGSMTTWIGRVDGQGMFGLPYAGRLKLAGQTDQQADAAIGAAYRTLAIIQHALVSVLRLESAPADAGKMDLPDVPIYPVPETLRWLYEQPQVSRQPAISK